MRNKSYQQINVNASNQQDERDYLEEIEGGMTDIHDLQFTSEDDTFDTEKQHTENFMTQTNTTKKKTDYATTTTTTTTRTTTNETVGLTAAPSSLGRMDGNTGNRSPNDSILTIILNSSAHPFVCITHILFKIAPIVLYIFSGFFIGTTTGGAQFIIVSVILICILAMDFYFTQKISGRLLVGLRWHNVLEPDGVTTRWIFESREGQIQVNPFDRIIFWFSLYMACTVWILFFFLDFLKLNLSWLIPCGLACALATANLYGFWKCSKDQQQRWHQMMTRGAEMGVNRVMASSARTGPGNNNYLVGQLVNTMVSSFISPTTNSGAPVPQGRFA